jgi:peptidoglycan hydrolase CwlO-like protein
MHNGMNELNRKVERTDAEIAELKQRLAKLEQLFNIRKGGGQ